MITAILDINNGQFESKIKMRELLREIRIPLWLPTSISFLQEAFLPDSPDKHKILSFEWKRQESKNTHRYTLKEIE